MIDLSLRIAALTGAGMVAVAGLAWFGHHERDIGRSQIQTKWDADKRSRQAVVVQAQASTANTEHAQAAKAAEVDTNVQMQIAAVAADRDRVMRNVGSLRDELARVRADAMSEATTRARLAAEAAAAADSLSECGSRYTTVAEQHDQLSIQVSGLLSLLSGD